MSVRLHYNFQGIYYYNTPLFNLDLNLICFALNIMYAITYEVMRRCVVEALMMYFAVLQTLKYCVERPGSSSLSHSHLHRNQNEPVFLIRTHVHDIKRDLWQDFQARLQCSSKHTSSKTDSSAALAEIVHCLKHRADSSSISVLDARFQGRIGGKKPHHDALEVLRTKTGRLREHSKELAALQTIFS